MIVGGGALMVSGLQAASLALADRLSLVRDEWNGYNVLHFSAARMGGLKLGWAQPGGVADIVAAKPELLFLLGADGVDFDAFDSAFKVYIGHHGERSAAHADVILPGTSYVEKSGTWVNLEGRVQRGRALFSRPVMRARTGRSSALSPMYSAIRSPSIRSTSCVM